LAFVKGRVSGLVGTGLSPNGIKGWIRLSGLQATETNGLTPATNSLVGALPNRKWPLLAEYSLLHLDARRPLLTSAGSTAYSSLLLPSPLRATQ